MSSSLGLSERKGARQVAMLERQKRLKLDQLVREQRKQLRRLDEDWRDEKRSLARQRDARRMRDGEREHQKRRRREIEDQGTTLQRLAQDWDRKITKEQRSRRSLVGDSVVSWVRVDEGAIYFLRDDPTGVVVVADMKANDRGLWDVIVVGEGGSKRNFLRAKRHNNEKDARLWAETVSSEVMAKLRQKFLRENVRMAVGYQGLLQWYGKAGTWRAKNGPLTFMIKQRGSKFELYLARGVTDILRSVGMYDSMELADSKAFYWGREKPGSQSTRSSGGPMCTFVIPPKTAIRRTQGSRTIVLKHPLRVTGVQHPTRSGYTFALGNREYYVGRKYVSLMETSRVRVKASIFKIRLRVGSLVRRAGKQKWRRIGRTQMVEATLSPDEKLFRFSLNGGQYVVPADKAEIYETVRSHSGQKVPWFQLASAQVEKAGEAISLAAEVLRRRTIPSLRKSSRDPDRSDRAQPALSNAEAALGIMNMAADRLLGAVTSLMKG